MRFDSRIRRIIKIFNMQVRILEIGRDGRGCGGLARIRPYMIRSAYDQIRVDPPHPRPSRPIKASLALKLWGYMIYIVSI